MEWISQWAGNLAVYFIFLSAVMNLLPGGEEKKYLRFFLGLLLILLVLKPVLELKNLDTVLEGNVLAETLADSYAQMVREEEAQKRLGESYVKDACGKELESQVRQLVDSMGYQTQECQVIFFEGETLEIEEIAVRLTVPDTAADREEKSEILEKIKNRLEEVYNIPQGNINISIQG